MQLIQSPTSVALSATFTPNSAPGRALNAAFQPSTTRPTLVMYTVRIAGAATANLTGGRIELRSDTANPPTTNRCQARSQWKVTGALTTMLDEQDVVLTYLVPAGHFVDLVSTTENGAPTFTLVVQTEIIL